MYLTSLLDIAIGDIGKGVMSPRQTAWDALEYYRRTPSLSSMLEILESMDESYTIPRTRYIRAPMAHNFDTALVHIKTCTNSAYRLDIPYVPISINDWFTYGRAGISIDNGIFELRKALLVHINKENVMLELDDYIHRYYFVLVKSLIETIE